MSADVFTLFRRFRHDLLNQLQIVSGHLQLGRSHQELRQDVAEVVERIQEISLIFTCQNDRVALAFWGWLEQARDQEISVSFELSAWPNEVPAADLEYADRLVNLLLAEIGQLAEEERWLHLCLRATEATLSLTTPAIPLTGLLAAMPEIAALLRTGDDQDLEFLLKL